MKKIQTNRKAWFFNREINLNMIVQLVMLATLIISSWVNIQKQLCLLQHDVDLVLERQNTFNERLEAYNDKAVVMDCRVKHLERNFDINWDGGMQ